MCACTKNLPDAALDTCILCGGYSLTEITCGGNVWHGGQEMQERNGDSLELLVSRPRWWERVVRICKKKYNI
jgi:hypothetical protein